MTQFTAYTPAQFAAEFPRARGHESAVRYVAATVSPREFLKAEAVEVGAGEQAVQVGYTNVSKTKQVVRFAIIPAAE